MLRPTPRTTLTLHSSEETVDVDFYRHGPPRPDPAWIRILARGGREFALLTPREARHLARVLKAYADDLEADLEDLNAR